MIDFIAAHWDALAALAAGLLSLLTLASKHRQKIAELEGSHETKLAELKAQQDLGAQTHAHASIGKREDLVFNAITSQALSASEWMERALTAEASDRQRQRELETLQAQALRVLEVLALLEGEDDRNARSDLIAATLLEASARQWQTAPPPPEAALPHPKEDKTHEGSDC